MAARRFGSVRVRTTVGAVVVVGAALLVGAVALVGSMRHTLTRDVRAAARLRALEVATDLRSGPVASVLPAGADEDRLIQVLDEDGHVISSTPNVKGVPAVVKIPAGQSKKIDSPIKGEDDKFLAYSRTVDTPQGRRTVIVARSLDEMLESTGTVTRLLRIGLPILLVLVGFTTWKVVGRALRPVEAIRREVDEISAAELHRRVPDPDGDDEIARLAVTMNRMLDRLEEAQARQRRFISDASHELRSPVTSIRQHAEVALAHPERTSTSDLAGVVLSEDLRLQRLVDDLLFLARADERTLELARRPVDLDDLVFEEARRLRGGNELQIDTTSVSAGRVVGDAMGLRRVLRNLADNAARHARHRVAFALAERDGTVVLSVDDDGGGIPETERQRVLERFVRLDEARDRDHGGAGVGLAIVDELVRAHGGSLAITDSPLGGARVELRFRLASDELAHRGP
jgi:signal transduction histidine kinase